MTTAPMTSPALPVLGQTGSGGQTGYVGQTGSGGQTWSEGGPRSQAGPWIHAHRAVDRLGEVGLRRVTRTCLGLATVATLVAAALLLVLPVARLTALNALISVAFLSVPLLGATLVRSTPHSPLGWVLLLGGVSFATRDLLTVWGSASVDRGVALPAGHLAAALAGVFATGQVVITTYGVLLIPDGRLPGRRWRWALVPAGLDAVFNVMVHFTPDYLPHGMANPIALPGVAGSVMEFGWLYVVLIVPSTGLAALGLTRRWRRLSGGPERQALKPVVVAVWVGVSAYVACLLIPNATYAYPFERGSAVALAVVCWLGITRYGLFDVRLVLNRALVYAGLTIAVLAVYAVVAALVGTAVRTPAGQSARLHGVGGAAAVAVACLVALPVRQLLQRSVDSLVWGRARDPYAAVAGLSGQLRAVADPGAALPAVARTVAEALRSPHVQVRTAAGVVAEHRRPGLPGDLLVVPLGFAGELVGELVVAGRGPGERFTSVERRLLDDLGPQVALAVRAVGLTSALQASRERLVSAREEERLRIRRDLHDGLGPTLTGVQLGISRAAGVVAADPAGAAASLESLAGHVRAAVRDIRRLVHELRPPVLDELGLAGALAAEAYRLGAEFGSGPLPELSAAVEVAAYRIVSEALTNAARHSGAARTTVTAAVTGDRLVLEVRDDGCGVPPDAVRSVGTASMVERAAELGGTCSIGRGADGIGTVVRAVLPLGRPAAVVLADRR